MEQNIGNNLMEISFDDKNLWGLEGGKVGDIYGVRITKIRYKNKNSIITLDFIKLNNNKKG